MNPTKSLPSAWTALTGVVLAATSVLACPFCPPQPVDPRTDAPCGGIVEPSVPGVLESGLTLAGRCADPGQRGELGALGPTIRVALAIRVTKVDNNAIVTPASIAQDVALANALFAPAGIEFWQSSYEEIDDIAADADYNVTIDPIFDLKGVLTVLYVRTLTSPTEGAVGGIGWGKGVVVARNSRDFDQVLAHELAHSLGVRHTDFPNGDDVADTPFDPGPGVCQAQCGTAANACECSVSCDPPHEQEHPDVLNVMAHYTSQNTALNRFCAEHFTPGQLELARCALRTAPQVRLTCGATQTVCGDKCVTLATSEKNCGACGKQCTGADTCAEGECVDPHGCSDAAPWCDCMQECGAVFFCRKRVELDNCVDEPPP